MSAIQSTVSNGDKSTATISHESLLEASELLQDNLGSPELTSRSVQWDNFPALMKLWEVLWQAQASLVQEAERLAEVLEDISQQDTRLQEIQADLAEIKAGKQEERDRHFALSLYWRRHAIWRYFRTHLQHPEEARDLLHLYLVKPAGGGQQTGEACRPKCKDKSEQSLLLQVASTQRNRIRQLAQWLADHPEAAALLDDIKGKGKGKARQTDPEEITQKHKAHFERCLEEIEPRQRLRELSTSTGDWIECFRSRLNAVQQAQHTVHTLQERRRRRSIDKVNGTEQSNKRVSNAASAAMHDGESKRRRTIDRGTSPIQEIQELVDKSIYLEQSRDLDIDHDPAPEMNADSTENHVKPGLLAAGALQEDDSPPSPQSLPSPPPHAQIRQQGSTTTDESQQSTNESSSKPIIVPSVRSMAPVQSSCPADDGFKITIVRDTTTTTVQDNAAEQTASTSRVKVARKPKKRASRLPPPSPEVLSRLEEAAREAEIRRKEEKARLGEFEYDPWEGLIGWVPPETPSDRQPVLPEPVQQVTVEQTIQANTDTSEVSPTKSRKSSTFEALEAESSETQSQGRREREENEASIAEFLRSEEL